MIKLKLTFIIATLLLALGCQSVRTVEQQRERSLQGELVVSPGVRRLFDDPEVDQLIAGVGNEVKCIRERRVGTHMVMRICRTKDEWAYLAQQTRETYQQNRMFGVCGGRNPLPGGDCGEGRGSL